MTLHVVRAVYFAATSSAVGILDLQIIRSRQRVLTLQASSLP